MTLTSTARQTFMVPRQDIAPFVASGADVNAAFLYVDDGYNLRRSPDARTPPIAIRDPDGWRAHCDRNYFGRTAPRTYEKHRWNESFEWQPTKGPFRLIDEAQARFYDENGYVVFPEAVARPVVDRLVEEADRVEAERQKVLASLRDGKGFIARADEISFTTHLVRKSDFVKNFYRSQLFRDIAHDFVGPTVRLYWDQAVYKKPGVEKPFPWHQDNGYTFVAPQQYITVWIALDDASRDNGCMWFVPGVHRLGTVKHELTDLGYALYCDEPPADAVPVECKAGTVIVLSALCPHMTAHNRTAQTRRALVAQFVGDGSYQLTEDPETGSPVRQEVDDERRQFLVLRDNQAVL
jgi:ectoine hydroxylase-related dioxygenase (phytanoyl-CoA dioxygenase family)